MLCVIDRCQYCVHQKDGEVLTQVRRWTVSRSSILFHHSWPCQLILGKITNDSTFSLHIFSSLQKRNATHFSRFSSSQCFRHRPLANTRDTSQVEKDGFTRWNWNSALAPPATTPLWYCTSYNPLPGWRTPPSNIVTSCVSLPPLPRSSLDTLQSPATVSEGTRKRMSTIHSRAFKFPVNLFHWMQSCKIHWPQPAFFSVLLLILAVQCSLCSYARKSVM